ncbi:5' nucleotidase, NT5C type [Microbacterium paludicola]|uniref:5' nucleotidase, NT5C type n=1 Tax=Microbacterium paludicola TaxID=300019 RepID=UPI0011A71018|nr:5'-3'-deoxyribonucleotidase [Microbacterium paludicola]
MLVLVDMDDVVAQWAEGYDSLLDEHGEAAAAIPRHADRLHWDLRTGRSGVEKKIIEKVMREPGFYRFLRAVPGARTALRQIRDAGHDIRFVSAPYISNPTCASDKIAWIERHYGARWAQRVILTTDKTLVRGDVLIDDRPDITGAVEPVWEHVVFTQPYNAHITDRRRMSSWSEWRNILG